MKAAICKSYGPPAVVTVQECPDPVPEPEEVLVSVEFAGLTSADARICAACAPAGMGPFMRLVFGLRGPRRPILGREYAGRVMVLGSNASRFRVAKQCVVSPTV